MRCGMKFFDDRLKNIGFTIRRVPDRDAAGVVV
jgi:hypothetical protein